MTGNIYSIFVRPNIKFMRKKILLLATICFILFSITSNAQTNNCEELKKENEYLKKAMRVTTPLKTITSSKIDFNFLECKGNTKEQTVEFVMSLVSHDANQEFQFNETSAVDMEGNEYPYGNVSIGGKGVRNTIRTDIPIKTVVVFKKVLPAVKMLKDIAISYFYGEPGHHIEIEFKDVPVKWQ